jgi:hypothetical protein
MKMIYATVALGILCSMKFNNQQIMLCLSEFPVTK